MTLARMRSPWRIFSRCRAVYSGAFLVDGAGLFLLLSFFMYPFGRPFLMPPSSRYGLVNGPPVRAVGAGTGGVGVRV